MRRRETLLTKWRKEEKKEGERKKVKEGKKKEEEEEEKKIGNVCDFKPFRRGNRDRSSSREGSERVEIKSSANLSGGFNAGLRATLADRL